MSRTVNLESVNYFWSEWTAIRHRRRDMGPIKDIDKGNGEVIRIEISEFKGQQYLNIRTWYTDKEGELKPTQKGITVRPELFAQLKEGLEAAEPAIKQLLGES